jgi:hypothetical protein
MSLVDLEDAQSRVGDGITQDQIDEVEEFWTSQFGPLVGSRTETFYLGEARRPRWQIDGLWISRRASNVIVYNDEDLLTAGTDYRFLGGLLIEKFPNGASWLDTIHVTYSPNDEELVRSVIYDTLTYQQTPTGIQSIRIGAYSETFFPAGSGGSTAIDPVLDSLRRRVLPAAGMGLTSPFRYSAGRRDRTLITGGGS